MWYFRLFPFPVLRIQELLQEAGAGCLNNHRFKRRGLRLGDSPWPCPRFFPGFHLSATVVPPQMVPPKGAYNVAVMFDRCRVTSCSCTCGAGAKWCTHVVALCLFRIHNVSPPHLSWPCPPLHPLLLCCVPGHSVNPFASRTRPLCPQLRCWQVFPQIVSLLSVLPSGFCGLPAGPRVRVPVSAAEGPTAEICSVPHQ